MTTMMKKSAWMFVLFFLPLFATAQITVTSLGQTISVDFDSSTPGVCDGPIKGTGFTPNPAVGSGMMDSDVVAFDGLTNPVSMDFGGTATTGDAARGIANNGNNGSGFYAFEPTGGTGRAFGFQPSSNHFNPGTVTLKFTNMTGEPINEFSVGLEVYLKNDSNRSTTYDIGVSTDGINFMSQQGFSTSQVPGFLGTGWLGPNSFLIGGLLTVNQEVCLPEPVLDGMSVFLRFEISDDGVGSDMDGDELAFDNINFTVSNRAYCAAVDVSNLTETSSANNMTSTLTWTNSVNCLDGVIVVASEDVPVTTDVGDVGLDGVLLSAIDGTTNINNDWSTRNADNEVFAVTTGAGGTTGQDYFVYKGTGTSVDVTGLDPSKTYHFKVITVSAGCDWATGVDVVQIAPLATELLSFEVEQKGQNTHLNWQAIHDENHNYTVIEHSTDGLIFDEIAKFNPSDKLGLATSYFYNDKSASKGNNYYRLKMVNLQEIAKYSTIQSIYLKTEDLVQVIPFSKEGYLKLLSSEAWNGQSYSIYNTNGQLIQEGILSDSNISIALVSGIYYLKIENRPTLDFVWLP